MMRRSANGWGYLFVLLPLLKWVIPFVVLMAGAVPPSESVILPCRWVFWPAMAGYLLDVVPVFSESFVAPAGSRRVFVMFAGAVWPQPAVVLPPLLAGGDPDPRLEESLKGRYLHV